MRMRLFRKLRVLEKILFYFWTKVGSNVVWHFTTVFFFLIILIHNLISVSKLRQNGAQVNFGWSLNFSVNGKATIPFEKHANFQVLKGKAFGFCSFSGENEEAVLWRHRLDHNHFENVKHLAHHVSGTSLKNSVFDKLVCCEVCRVSKSRQQPVSRKMEKRKASKLDFVFTDILGPIPNYFAWWQSIRYFFYGQLQQVLSGVFHQVAGGVPR